MTPSPSQFSVVSASAKIIYKAIFDEEVNINRKSVNGGRWQWKGVILFQKRLFHISGKVFQLKQEKNLK
jgi:hypothetical protein